MTDPDAASLCPGCFAAKGAVNPCPSCGFDEQSPRPAQALPPGTLLNGQFLIGRVLGKPGGFGITYLGWDRNLETTVAIKEYLPRDLAVRAADGASIRPHTTDEVDLFRYGLDQFMVEARTLARLDHPNIVRVRQFFEANGSAYLVMDYYEGLSLGEELERRAEYRPGGRIGEQSALALMQPILDGLRAVHAQGFLHRDIKPHNIYLARTDNRGVRPILLDFGAARQAMGDRSRSMSVVISPGYAPFEQYHRKGQQGPASDIYSAAAVLYRMVTGETPPEATERMAGDTLRPAAAFGVSLPVSNAIASAMAMDAGARPQSVEAFQEALASTMAAARGLPQSPSPAATAPSPPPSSTTTPVRQTAEQAEPQFYRPIGPPTIPASAPPQRKPAAAVVQSPPDRPPAKPRSNETARVRRPATWIGAGIGFGLMILVVVSLFPPGPPKPAPMRIPPEVLDRQAFEAALSSDSASGYEQYLERCATEQCASDGEALVRLGLIHEEGRGVPKDDRKAITYYAKAAERQHPDGEAFLGLAYLSGQGIEQDDAKAVKWLTKGAEQGHAMAQYLIGRLYQLGRGVTQSPVKGIVWIRKSAEAEHPIGQYWLGVSYRDGLGVAQDHRAAASWLIRSAEQDYAPAQADLGDLYAEGLGVAQDDWQAAQWFEKAARHDLPKGQDRLGIMYWTGRGVLMDLVKGTSWIEKAANQGDPSGQSNLGFAYAHGLGVPQDQEKAVRWYRKAADQGEPSAFNGLGEAYQSGRGVPQDLREAHSWYRKGADAGHAGSQNSLGYLYAEGLGVTQDFPEAVRWFRRAAEQDNVAAQVNLALLYADGLGVEQDDSQAARWYRKAADQGNPSAQTSLASLYLLGRGVPRDVKTAVTWLRRAAAQGYADADELLAKLATTLAAEPTETVPASAAPTEQSRIEAIARSADQSWTEGQQRRQQQMKRFLERKYGF